MPATEVVRGAMSVEVTFSDQTPNIDGTIDIFASESGQSVHGQLDFSMLREDDVFRGNRYSRSTHHCRLCCRSPIHGLSKTLMH